ncbi:hypothetical protein PLESTF_000971300 [Pleodorina starrii]|nr:hypothetical protein PLESTF_000971300 [Pleodorina starrii]
MGCDDAHSSSGSGEPSSGAGITLLSSTRTASISGGASFNTVRRRLAEAGSDYGPGAAFT